MASYSLYFLLTIFLFARIALSAPADSSSNEDPLMVAHQINKHMTENNSSSEESSLIDDIMKVPKLVGKNIAIHGKKIANATIDFAGNAMDGVSEGAKKFADKSYGIVQDIAQRATEFGNKAVEFTMKPIKAIGEQFNKQPQFKWDSEEDVNAVTDIEEYPYIVSLHAERSLSSKFCAGTIIAPKYVLTAAHCFDSINLENLHVGVGKLGNHQVTKVANIYQHPCYDKKRLTNDIALLELQNKIHIYDNVIDQLELEQNTETFENLKAIQYGSDMANKFNILYSNVTEINPEFCAKSFEITTAQICVGKADNTGVCTVESGAPLIQKIPTEKGLRQVFTGIASYTGRDCHKDPSVYTRVAPYQFWIVTVVTKNKNTVADSC